MTKRGPLGIRRLFGFGPLVKEEHGSREAMVENYALKVAEGVAIEKRIPLEEVDMDKIRRSPPVVAYRKRLELS